MGGRVQCPERLCYEVPIEARGIDSLGACCEGGKLTMASERSVTDDLSIGTDIVGQSVQMPERGRCIGNILSQLVRRVLVKPFADNCAQPVRGEYVE